MDNRRASLPTLTAGVMAPGVIVAPAIADERFGVITAVDVEGETLTVREKGADEDTVVTTADDTEIVFGEDEEPRKVDLEELAEDVQTSRDAGKKGVLARITREQGVASRIGVFARKKEAPKDR